MKTHWIEKQLLGGWAMTACGRTGMPDAMIEDVYWPQLSDGYGPLLAQSDIENIDLVDCKFCLKKVGAGARA